jgi:excinuclease ABC subunit B
VVRPTGLIDPQIEIKPTEGQIIDLEERIDEVIKKKQRVLVTTLTKKMAEELAGFLQDKKYKVAYLHSDIETLERSDILDSLRKGDYDVLVGINLLREGLDLPEVSLVAILDADKEGFLRSETSLIQTMGRAARHVNGQVIMYADKITGSMQRAIDEVTRRREIQIRFNKEHGITPESIHKPIRERILEKTLEDENNDIPKGLLVDDYEFRTMTKKKQKAVVKELENKMKLAADMLEFETAAKIRDRIRELKSTK